MVPNPFISPISLFAPFGYNLHFSTISDTQALVFALEIASDLLEFKFEHFSSVRSRSQATEFEFSYFCLFEADLSIIDHTSRFRRLFTLENVSYLIGIIFEQFSTS